MKSLKQKEAASYSVWSGRFTWAAIVQGAVVALMTAMLAAYSAGTLYPQMLVGMVLKSPAIGFIEVAALAGLGLYLIVGVIGTGVTAQFYHHFEVRAGRPYRGATVNALAWANLVLTNAGIAAASMMMILAGLLGDMAVSPAEFSGSGMAVEQAAEQVLNPFIVPVSVALLVAVAGAAAGGTGFDVNYFRR
jgi:hypothetical protein